MYDLVGRLQKQVAMGLVSFTFHVRQHVQFVYLRILISVLFSYLEKIIHTIIMIIFYNVLYLILILLHHSFIFMIN